MKIIEQKHWIFLLILSVTLTEGYSQITERSRPEKWNDLILGGRFMDRFLPMPVQGPLEHNTWGAYYTKPRYVENGIEDNDWSYWGGNALLGKDGNYHLFVCRWREDAEKGHMAWPNSEVVHAVSKVSTGPYQVIETIGKGHNPEIFQLEDGRFVLYVYKGYYLSNSLSGPWKYQQFDFNSRDRKIIEGLSNLSFTRREDGSILMVCRGGGIWISENGISPYHQVTQGSVYPPVDGKFEDPVIWRTSIQYHMIVNDWLGRIAYYLRSKDGIHWKIDPGEAYMPGIAKYEDGTKVNWFKYERIKMLQDQYGRAFQAHFAVIDTIKWNDLSNDHHSSKHICIPLTVGKLMTILNDNEIDANTAEIRVQINAEPGFNPHQDIDINSLRFGAPEAVNFGGGCKPLRVVRSGDDLIITFDGTGNGFSKTNFAAKLIGKTTSGQLLFAYSRLPWVDYLQPCLSARLPKFSQKKKKLKFEVEVQNFGQVSSKKNSKLQIKLVQGNVPQVVVSGNVPPLAPFEKTQIKMKARIPMPIEENQQVIVSILPPDQEVIELHGILQN